MECCFIQCLFLLFGVIRNAFFQEFDELVDVARLGIVALGQHIAVGVDDDIVGLSNLVELAALEMEIFAAQGLEYAAFVVGDVILFGKVDVVHIAIEGAHHILLVKDFLGVGVGPNILFHLAAVVAVAACKVDEYGFALLFGVCFGFVDVVEALESAGHMKTVGIFAVGWQGVVHHGVFFGSTGDSDVLGGFID